jgi:hypothetical protein
MSEKHSQIIKKLFDEKNDEILFSTHVTVVIISKTDGPALYGVLVNLSIAIPLSAPPEADQNLKEMVNQNLNQLDIKLGEKVSLVACTALGLPVNGTTLGFHSDVRPIGNVTSIHIHPKDHFENQEDFLANLEKVLAEKNIKLTINS